MTLHLALYSGNYVLHLSDRLLSVNRSGRFEDWWTRANKTVIVQARDGTVSIGFSRLAHISSLPADLWIIERLTGVETPTNRAGDGPPAQMFVGQSVRARVEDVISNLRKALDECLPHEAGASLGLDIVLTGWRWTPHVAKSVTAMLSHDGPGHVCQLGRYTSYRWHDSRFNLLATGQHALFSKYGLPLLRSLVRDKPRMDVFEMESYLLEAMRETASQPASGIGMEFMSVLMPGPNGAPTSVRFFRDPKVTDIWGFTPAMITDLGMIQYPVLFRGSIPSHVIHSHSSVDFAVFPSVPTTTPHLTLELSPGLSRRSCLSLC